MKLRPLVIDNKFKAQVARVVAYARAHPYIVGETITPGDDPGHVLKTVFGYKIVFSFTRVPSGLYRDLSISVDTPGKFPNPVAAFAIAAEFGFTGWDEKSQEPPDDWLISKDVHWDAIRLAQEITEE